MTTRRALGITAACLMVSGLASIGMASAQENSETIGKDEYRFLCQSCHGAGGKGDGYFAEILSVPPADITQLTKNNGGKFPLERVYQIIDGREEVRGHGSRVMPIWGQRYAQDADIMYGPFGGEQVVRARILELMYYVQLLQE